LKIQSFFNNYSNKCFIYYHQKECELKEINQFCPNFAANAYFENNNKIYDYYCLAKYLEILINVRFKFPNELTSELIKSPIAIKGYRA